MLSDVSESPPSSGMPPGLRNALLVAGVVLVLAGAVLLLTIGALAVQAVAAPAEFRLFEYVLGFLELDDRALYGVFDGRNFDIAVGESMRAAVYVFLGLAILGVAGGIVRTLLQGGVELIALAGGQVPWRRRRHEAFRSATGQTEPPGADSSQAG